MLRSILGTAIDASDGLLILAPAALAAPHALEIEILVPAYWTPALLTRLGTEVRVHTRVHLESQNQGASFVPRLLGFPSPADRAFFELFTSVKGLGQRRALRAMAEPPGIIAAAIARRDAKTLQKLPEIGKRLAETVIAELNGKVEPFTTEARAPMPEPRIAHAGPIDDAIAALIALGQPRADAEQAVARATAGDDPANLTTDEIIARTFAARP